MHSPEEKRPYYLGNFQTGNIIRPPDYCDPIGPSFSKAKKWKIDIEGTEITFRAPKHKPIEKRNKAKYPEARYHYQDMPFRDTFRQGLHQKDEWESSILFYHTWAFHGPILTGPLADISASLIILRYKQQRENTSFFHPRVFEHSIAEYLTNRYSMHKEDGQHEYIAPIEWLPVDGKSVPAARFKVITNDEVRLYSEVEYFFFALDDEHLASFAYHYNRGVLNAVTKADLDKHVGDKNLHELVDNIINSLSVTLSHEAQMQQQKALEGLDNTTLTKTFPPLKWDRDVEAYNETQRKIAAK